MNIVIALHEEAKPLIEEFSLKPIKNNQSPYKIFSSEDIYLIISGIGKIASAAASAYLYHLKGSIAQEAWLTVGVAGHREWPIGTLKRIDQIKDNGTRKVYYPHEVFEPISSGASLLTVDQIEKEYSEDFLYDMEGSGFFATVNRFSTAELISVYKVVSDNLSNPTSSINLKDIKDLMANHVKTFKRIIKKLKILECEQQEILKKSDDFQEILNRWKFSVTEKRKLELVVMKWETLFSKKSLYEFVVNSKNSKEVLEKIENSLNVSALDMAQ